MKNIILFMLTVVALTAYAQSTYNANDNTINPVPIIRTPNTNNCTSIGAGAYNFNPSNPPVYGSPYNTFYGAQAGAGITGTSSDYQKNTFVGALAGTNARNINWNTFIGYRAGANSNSITDFNGTSNTYVGVEAGNNANGGQNCFFGTMAGLYSTFIPSTPPAAGDLNTHNNFFGREAGAFFQGVRNNIFGSQWGSSGTTPGIRLSSDNCFFGTNAGYRISGGNQNIFMGTNAGGFNITGSNNIYLGHNCGNGINASNNVLIGSLIQTTTAAAGDNNTFLGFSAGNTTNVIGSNNISIGANSFISTARSNSVALGANANAGAGINNTNTIAIGANATIAQDNSMLLGAVNGNGIANGTYMHVGINTNTPGNPLGDNVPAQLHIFNCTDVADPNVTAGSATIHARIRFNNLPINANSNWFVTADATTGKLYRRQVNFAPVLCQTTNFVPKALNANGDMTCSQIFDDATSVAIGWAAPGGPPAGYANYTGVTTNITPGSIVPPATGIARLVVNGVTMTHGVSYTSDKRFKKDIKPVTSALDKIKKLNGVTYNWRKEEFKDKNFDGSNQIGFIAQEVEKVIPQAVVKDGEGYYAMNYTMLIPVLTEAMKEQQKMIEQQQKEIDELKSLVKGTTPKSVLDNPSKSIQLFQNVPNPFSKETDIRFFLPETVKQASLTIYDMQGKQLRKIDINDRNESSVKINAKELPAGMYMYSLIADGKEMDTKRMILTDY